MIAWIRKLALLGLAAAVSACATVSDGNAPPPPSGEQISGTVCIFSDDIRSWRRLDDRNIIVYARARQPYLVELFRPVPGLSYEFRVGFYDRDGRLCPFGGDALIVNGIQTEAYQIVGITRLSPERLQELLTEYGLDTSRDVENDDVTVQSLPPEGENGDTDADSTNSADDSGD